jgi:muconolactone delta-isomerase
MWSMAGWELRVFIPLDRPPATTTAQQDEGDLEQLLPQLDVFRWAKRHKKDLKKAKREQEEKEEAKTKEGKKKKDKKKDKKKNKKKNKNKKKGSKLAKEGEGDDEEEGEGGKPAGGDEQQESKKRGKKKGGPTERRTDFYIHVDNHTTTRPAAAPSRDADAAAVADDAMEDADAEAEAALGRWVEEGCGLKLRGGAWGHQLELKVRTGSDASEDDAAASLCAERWVKLALPRVSGDDVVLPPCTVTDLVALHRAIGAAVVHNHHGSEAWLSGGWRGLVRAAGQFVRERLFAAQDDEAAHERAQVAMARQAIGRRLMIAAGVASDTRHEPEAHQEEQRDAEAPEALPEPLAPTSAPPAPAVEAETAAAAAEAPLCGVWRVDKARRQRNIKWPGPGHRQSCAADPSTETEGRDEAEEERDEDRHRGMEVLVVEQTDIFTFTYHTSTAHEDPGLPR